MPSITIKDIPDEIFEALKFKSNINDEIISFLKKHYKIRKKKKYSITQLKGLGKELWEKQDAQVYVNKERELW